MAALAAIMIQAWRDRAGEGEEVMRGALLRRFVAILYWGPHYTYRRFAQSRVDELRKGRAGEKPLSVIVC